MVRISVVFFVWICNKRGGFLSPYFSLDLFYCNWNFVSQNLHRKFVNHWRIITGKRAQTIDVGNFSNERPTAHTAARAARAPRGQQRALHTQQLPRARCKRAERAVASSCSMRPATAVRATRSYSGSQRHLVQCEG